MSHNSFHTQKKRQRINFSYLKCTQSQRYLSQKHPQIKDLVKEDFVHTTELIKDIYLVIDLGGNGTVLHISHFFKGTVCPPILGFNLGKIGFLLWFGTLSFMTFNWKNYRNGNWPGPFFFVTKIT